jgi:hypothetical protein
MRISNLVGQIRNSIDEPEEGPTAPLGGMLTAVGGCLDLVHLPAESERRERLPCSSPGLPVGQPRANRSITVMALSEEATGYETCRNDQSGASHSK